jgi:GT2 family glycosyltransferase
MPAAPGEWKAVAPAGQNEITIAVVVPTYRRPGPLIDCVRSLVAGSRQPDEIIVVGREDDTPTKEALVQAQEMCAGKSALRMGWVTQPGHVPPVEKGLALASSDIVAFVDDDVTVTPDWLRHLLAPFSDPSVGVVGGRVITPACQPPRLKGRPGCISWYGKHWGNVAWLPGESPIEVQGAMEGNCAWRRELLASLKFDPVLNFDDASMYGLDLCLQAASSGYRVLYEPRALVYHHAAPRAPDLDRADGPRRIFSYTRNYTYLMLKHLPWWRRPIFLAWWFLIGERGSWGLAAVLADTLTGRLPPFRDVWGALTGKVEGILVLSSGTRGMGASR